MGHQIFDLETFITEAPTTRHPRLLGLLLLDSQEDGTGRRRFATAQLKWLDRPAGSTQVTFFIPVVERQSRRGTSAFRNGCCRVAGQFGIVPDLRPGVVLMLPSLDGQALYLPLVPRDFLAGDEAVAEVFNDLFTLVAAAIDEMKGGPVGDLLAAVQQRFNKRTGTKGKSSRFWKGPATSVSCSLSMLRRLALSFFKGDRQGVEE